MTTQPRKNPTSDVFTVSRELSPAHAVIWLALQDHPPASLEALTGIRQEAALALASHLLAHGYTDHGDIPFVAIPEPIPSAQLDDASHAIYTQLTVHPTITRALNIAGVPPPLRPNELAIVAQLAAEERVKDPIRYAQRIILNRKGEYANHPDNRQRTGRTPVEPG